MNLVGAIVKRYGKGTDSDATDPFVVNALDCKGGGADDNDVQAGHLIGTIRSHPRPGSADPGLITHTLRSEGFDASEDGTGRGTPLIPGAAEVRRLTPVECERLQALPDDWTAVDGPGAYEPRKGGWKCVSGTPDGPRYAACGDAVTTFVAEWIFRRLLDFERGGLA